MRLRTRAVSALAALLLSLLPASTPAQETDLDGVGFALGATDAPLTIVEYADFACSACALFARDTWPAIRGRYVETRRVRWWIVPFELGFRNSEEGARAARCAAEENAFWEMHDALFLRRDEWVRERRPEAALIALAASVGIDRTRFEACYRSGRMEGPAGAANRSARRAAVRGTPTFFIGSVAVQGALPMDAFVELIEKVRD